MVTLFGPRLSAGSSIATDGSGVGAYQPACAGWPGSDTSMTCSPPECHESMTRSWVRVGLCAGELWNWSVAGSSAGLPWNAGEFGAIWYWLTRCGLAGLATFQIRSQPQGQPNEGVVKVPYTSSMVNANGRPGNGIAEWLS